MTDTEIDFETQAQRIAERGRSALLERVRIAYSDAAAAHADLISLDDEQIEAMVQSATNRADGLQWRRALASVAAEELGIDPSEALSHAAVVRAQQLVGAPSYEQSLAEMIARPVPPPAPTNGNGSMMPAADEPVVGVAGSGVPEPEPAAGELEHQPAAGLPEPEPPEPQPPLPDPVPEPPAPEPEPEPDPEPVPGPAFDHAGAAEELGGEETRSDALETVEADDVVLELLPEPDPVEYETEAYDVEAGFTHEQLPPAPVNPFPARAVQATDDQQADDQQPDDQQPDDEQPDDEQPDDQEHAPATEQYAAVGVAEAVTDDGDPSAGVSEHAYAGDGSAYAEESAVTEIVIPAVHLGGVANLPTKREGLSVRLSADGLDIMQGPRDIIGRLVWDEIEALEVPNLRVRRRSKQLRARLVVRTPHGDASFEVPDVAGDELRERVEPIMELYGRG